MDNTKIDAELVGERKITVKDVAPETPKEQIPVEIETPIAPEIDEVTLESIDAKIFLLEEQVVSTEKDIVNRTNDLNGVKAVIAELKTLRASVDTEIDNHLNK